MASGSDVSVSRVKSAQELFRRYRAPGDLVFAVAFLIFSGFLASRLGDQVTWTSGTRFTMQPAFWPTVSVIAMTVFAALHWIGSICSPRIPGRWEEVWFWFRALEYGTWFIAYVLLVPKLGYLVASVLFTVVLLLRVGYRGWVPLSAGVALATVTVVLFRAVLQVKVPSGALYEYLPGAIRSFSRLYL